MFKKADIILIAIVILISFSVLLALYLVPHEGEPVVSIYIDGEKIESYPLDSEYTEVPIYTHYGYNLLIISENMAFIHEADCTSQSCVATRTISTVGSQIVCAPHHLVIKIEDIAYWEED